MKRIPHMLPVPPRSPLLCYLAAFASASVSRGPVHLCGASFRFLVKCSPESLITRAHLRGTDGSHSSLSSASQWGQGRGTDKWLMTPRRLWLSRLTLVREEQAKMLLSITGSHDRTGDARKTGTFFFFGFFERLTSVSY